VLRSIGSMLFKLVVYFLDSPLEHDKVSYVQSDIEHKNENDHNSVSESSKLESKEDLSNCAEELKCTHHQ